MSSLHTANAYKRGGWRISLMRVIPETRRAR